ncbi:lysr family regulatory [Fusarium longipes]|uniref:Lysr family regulatory n=1 Tax=Fusarium longipes TaxID=694270 RepID=A0A395RGR9_9HYPO|nr:lysr family regulatory [Fusarium longipes]
MLGDSLSQLIALPGWNKLGGRIRMNSNNKLEIHVPKAFSPERPAFRFHHTDFDISIDEHPLASKLPKPSMEQPSVQELQSDLTTLGVPPGTPLCLDDYLKSDSPQLTVHIVSFTDATLVSICWPHVSVDGMSLAQLGHAWSLALAGRVSEILPMLSTCEDPMAKAGQDPAFTQPHPLERKQITGWRLYIFAFYYIFDLIWWRTIESRVVFLPKTTVRELRNRALLSLTKEDQTPFVSESDVIVAWLTIVVVSALFPKGSNRAVTIGNAFDLRGRAPSLFPVTGDKGAYIQNAVFPCWALVSATTVHRRDGNILGSVALAVRRSIQEQTTESSIHAQARLTRNALDQSGVPPLFGDANQFTIHFASVKADLARSLDLGPAIKSRSRSPEDKISAKDTWAPSPGHPVYYHIKCISPSNMLARNYSLVTKTSTGDYWVNGSYPPEVWKLMQLMLLSFKTLDSASSFT